MRKPTTREVFVNVRTLFSTLACALSIAAVSPANATVINGGFESNFSGWTVTGDGYLVTQTGSSRVRHDYQTYQGWEGADVWFGNNPAPGGSTYAVFGSKGNESVGSLTSSLWTATNQFISFWTAGNNTSWVGTNRAYAEILSDTGAVLAHQYVTSYNDSVWRQFSFDLAAIGLGGGDQFSFRFTDGYSWSVIDNVAEYGPALPSADVPEPTSLALVGIGILALARRRRAS
jgi:PEP-CTERM motif